MKIDVKFVLWNQKKNIFTSMLHLVKTFNSSWLYILEISIFYVLIIYAQLSISIDHIVFFLQFLRFDCIFVYLSNANNHGRQCRRSLIIFYALWSVLSEFFLPLSFHKKLLNMIFLMMIFKALLRRLFCELLQLDWCGSWFWNILQPQQRFYTNNLPRPSLKV